MVRREGSPPIQVDGTLPGERWRLRVSNRGNVAERVECLEPGPDRVVPECPLVDACGGCAWQHVSAERQRAERAERVVRALPQDVRDVHIDTVTSSLRYGYRTRTRLAWASAGGSTRVGYRAKRSHDVVDAPQCPVLDERLSASLGALRDELASIGGSGEVLLALGSSGAVASIHPDGAMNDPRTFGIPDRLVARGFEGARWWAGGATVPATAGDPRVSVPHGDATLTLDIDAFAQAHATLNDELVRAVRAAAASEGKDVLELFAGGGNFTVALAPGAKQVTAVESDPRSVASLESNVRERGLSNVRVVAADAVEIVRSRRADVVVLDPPRTGAREVCELLAKSKSKRVVYVSCDAATLGRDLGILAPRFALESLTLFEMFPQTPHVEALAVLSVRRTRSPI